MTAQNKKKKKKKKKKERQGCSLVNVAVVYQDRTTQY